MAGNARDVGRSTASRMLAILSAFEGSATRLTLSELARRSELPKTTVLRLVDELVAWGALDRGADASYAIGIRVWKLGLLASANSGLRDVALPYLDDLHRATGENVQLAILDGDAALLVEHIHGSLSVETVSERGRRIPLHATAVGKVLAAYSETAQEALLARRLVQYTDATIVDKRRLRAALARVRTTGVAYVFDELTEGAASVAVPVRDADGDVCAALSLVLRSGGVSPYRLAAALRTAAFGVGRQLALFR